MGASNAIAAFRLYSARVPATAMAALAYMALVSIDKDDEPWFQLGSEVIAVMALGREPLAETGDAKADSRAQKATEVACERALRPLFEAGAITTARHSSGHPGNPRHAKYRLWLSASAPDEKRDPRHRSDRGTRPTENVVCETPPAKEGAPYGNHRAPDDGTLRNPCQRPTESVAAPYEIRRAKEDEEDEERSKNLEEYSPPSSDSVPVRAGEARDGAQEVPSVRVIASPLLAVVPTEEKSRCRYADCPGRAEDVNDDGHHPSTCAYLAGIKTAREASAEAS